MKVLEWTVAPCSEEIEILHYEDYRSDPFLTFATSKVSEWAAPVPGVTVHF